MTSSSTAYLHGVKCSLWELKGHVEGALGLGEGNTSFLKSVYREGAESFSYQM